MARRNMYSSTNIRNLRGTEVAYNSVDVTSYAAFINSLTDEEKKKCYIDIAGGNFDVIGIRLICDNKKDIDMFNKVVEKAGNILKSSYININPYMNNCCDDEED